MGDHAAGTDGCAAANGDAGKDGDRAANPDGIADGDGKSPFPSGVTLVGVCAVAGGVDAHIRSDEAIVADGDGCLVENGEIEVGKETTAQTYLLAIIATERLVDDGETFSSLSSCGSTAE